MIIQTLSNNYRRDGRKGGSKISVLHSGKIEAEGHQRAGNQHEQNQLETVALQHRSSERNSARQAGAEVSIKLRQQAEQPV